MDQVIINNTKYNYRQFLAQENCQQRRILRGPHWGYEQSDKAGSLVKPEDSIQTFPPCAFLSDSSNKNDENDMVLFEVLGFKKEECIDLAIATKADEQL